MTVKLYTFLRARIHTDWGKIRDFFDADDRTYRKLTVKFVDGRDAFDL